MDDNEKHPYDNDVRIGWILTGVALLIRTAIGEVWRFVRDLIYDVFQQ